MDKRVYLFDNCIYNSDWIFSLLPDEVFNILKDAEKVVLKPNWVKHSHMEKPGEWDYVITHPEVITGVLKKVIEKMPAGGTIKIIDGPEMTTRFDELISHYPVELWHNWAHEKNITMDIIDLREDIWYDNGNVVVKREKKIGDPRGNTLINVKGDKSEFFNHKKSRKGYFGADSDIKETNQAHDGINNLYRLSKSVMECDVFINLPKLKTHKKAGITCCLKNLVGINTYRNYLPHYSIGTHREGGDQFPVDKARNIVESRLNPLFHQYIRTNPFLSRLFSPLMSLGRVIFGTNKETNRSGSWYGNDTIWRMILDINKALFYGEPDGTIKENNISNRKKYIGVVDAVLCGDGYGPKTPDPFNAGQIVVGTNPVTIDTVCALIMGFDPHSIPSINNAYTIKNYPLTINNPEDIIVIANEGKYSINNIPDRFINHFNPASGWKGHIEKINSNN